MKKSLLNINKSLFSSIKKTQSQQNNTNVISWDDRNKASKLILNNEIVIISTPEKEISNDVEYTVYIYIDHKGSWVNIDFGCEMPCEDIPELCVNKWNKQSYSYFKHWLSKVFDEPSLKRSDKFILISVDDHSWKKMEEKHG